MRWLPLAVMLALAVPDARAESRRNPFEGYATRSGWRKVRTEVLGWFGTTKNGCVAFASTALRQRGIEVPLDARVDGERVSLLTLPFSRYLEETLGFVRVTRAADLRAGDLVFTEHADYPAHVYVFHAWRDRARGIARVIDNQGPLHERNVWSTGSGNWTPFAYALRAPR